MAVSQCGGDVRQQTWPVGLQVAVPQAMLFATLEATTTTSAGAPAAPSNVPPPSGELPPDVPRLPPVPVPGWPPLPFMAPPVAPPAPCGSPGVPPIAPGLTCAAGRRSSARL